MSLTSRVSVVLSGALGLAALVLVSAPRAQEVASGAREQVSGSGQGAVQQLPPETSAMRPRGPAATPQEEGRVPIRIDRRLVKGDVIARGARLDLNRDGFAREEECKFDFAVEIALESGSRSVDLRKGPNCTLLLEDIHDVDVVEPPDAVAGGSRPAEGLLARLWQAVFPVAQAQGNRKRSYQNVMHYGYGGQWDILTEVWGNVDWTYDGTNAVVFSMYGYCNAKSNITGWWMNGCWLSDAIYSATTSSTRPYVTNLTDGHFFWDIPPQGGSTYYHHVLSNRRSGTPSGIGTCQYYYVGSIVLGVYNNCQVGPI